MSIAQEGQVVKCTVEGCEEEAYREELCWECFIAEKLAEWDAQDAEREASMEGVGYVLGDRWDPALDGAWYGYATEEVCR